LGRLKPLGFREIKRRLESVGFEEVSQKGSHVKFARISRGRADGHGDRAAQA
jgi:predicted RNA binding protein YcfA (HicA-like mRNA interferase family)